LRRQREKKEPGARRRFVTQLAAFALGCVLLLRAHRKQPRILETLQGLTIPLYVASRVPQVLKIARERSAGHLSAVTFAANLLGSVGRLYTTKHELGGDRVLVTGFIVSIALNALLVAQILYFGPGAEGASAAARKLRHDE
jgi:mannose-P-dolichol utilization defect protein 1